MEDSNLPFMKNWVTPEWCIYGNSCDSQRSLRTHIGPSWSTEWDNILPRLQQLPLAILVFVVRERSSKGSDRCKVGSINLISERERSKWWITQLNNTVYFPSYLVPSVLFWPEGSSANFISRTWLKSTAETWVRLFLDACIFEKDLDLSHGRSSRSQLRT